MIFNSSSSKLYFQWNRVAIGNVGIRWLIAPRRPWILTRQKNEWTCSDDISTHTAYVFMFVVIWTNLDVGVYENLARELEIRGRMEIIIAVFVWVFIWILGLGCIISSLCGISNGKNTKKKLHKPSLVWLGARSSSCHPQDVSSLSGRSWRHKVSLLYLLYPCNFLAYCQGRVEKNCSCVHYKPHATRKTRKLDC